MSRIIATAVFASCLTISAAPAESSDWAFRRSWFTDAPAWSPDNGHILPPGSVPRSRSAYRPAIPQQGPGFAVRTKYRYNYYRLFNGQSWDTTVYREFSFQETP